MRGPKIHLAWLIGAAIFALVGLLPAIQAFDLRAMDLFWRSKTPHPDIAIIAIDNASLQEIGRWPWSRSVHARFLRQLEAAKPRAVGIDIMWSEAENAQADTALADAVKAATFPVVLPAEEIRYAQSDATDTLLPLTVLRTQPSVTIGHVGIPPESDGFSRSFPRLLTTDDGTYRAFGVEMATRLGATVPSVGHAFIDFAGPAGTFPTYSYTDVLNGRVPAQALEGKIILIGATASDFHDTALTPFGVTSGVEWHANILNTVMLSAPIIVVSRLLVALLCLLFALLAFIVFHLLPARVAFGALGLFLVVPPIVSIVAWRSGYVLPYAYADLLVLLSFVAHTFERWYHAEKERRTLRRSLQSYLSPSVLEAVIKDPSMIKLGGTRREITAMFTDIRSFTTISESTDPHVLANLLYEYFTAMTEEVFATDGVVAQFAGDGMYAFWGSPIEQPNHSEHAVRSGIRMMRKLEELRVGWAERGLPYVDIGIGLNCGMATVGNLGSAKRFDFTAIGDCVNAAARLEALNKEHKTHILISELVQKKLPSDIITRFVAEVLVKGKTVPLRVHEVTEENWKKPEEKKELHA